LLEKLGLRRPEVRAWAMYDWANSAMAAVVVTAVFPVYYHEVAGADLAAGIATKRHALATTVALTCVALVAPFLGALADSRPLKKRLLGLFMGLGVLATAGMFFVQRGDWLLGALLFALANIGASGSFVFYDSLLPHIARPHEIDRVSASGYALGYLGGGLALGLVLLWIRFPHHFGLEGDATLPVRLGFVAVALWWLIFSIPLFRRVREPPLRGEPSGSLGRDALRQLRSTLGELRRFRQALLMLLAFLIYNDGILTIIRMSTIYGREIGLATSHLLLAILLVHFVGVPCAVLFGIVGSRSGPKRTLYVSLTIFCVISFLGFRMSTAAEFFLLAVLVSMFLGGTQALSRSLFASLIPKEKSSEFFALFAVAEKFAGILGPAVFALLIELTGSSRVAILSIVVFFVIGGLLLRRVDVDAGRQVARAAEAASDPT
jgi:UMF1 family MFS transporter